MTPQQASDIIRDYALSIRDRVVSPPDGLLRHPFVKAGIEAYPVLVDWDAVWGGLFYLQEGDPDPLRGSLLNLLEHTNPDGKGQRRIDITRYSAMPYQIRPFLQTGCYLLSQAIGTDWLGDTEVKKLIANLSYWHRFRIGRHGLLTWLHVDEGFADNGLQNWAWEPLAVEAVDLNAQIIREHRALAWILDAKGQKEAANEQRSLADQLAVRLESALWHPEDSFYYSLYNPPRRFDPPITLRVQGYSNLWPLWIKLTPPERAVPLLRSGVLNNQTFLSPFGIRSLSLQDRCFNNMFHGYSNPMTGSPASGPVFQSNCSNWQGPLWVVPNVLVVESLVHYGLLDEAKALADQVVIFFAERLKRDGRFFENYHSETGEPLCAPGIASWTLLLAHLHRSLEKPMFAIPG